MLRKIWTVIAWMILLTIPLISVGGFMAAHGLLNRVLISAVLYSTGIVFGILVGILLARIGGLKQWGMFLF